VIEVSRLFFNKLEEVKLDWNPGVLRMPVSRARGVTRAWGVGVRGAWSSIELGLIDCIVVDATEREGA
jgi:hypothetical protein